MRLGLFGGTFDPIHNAHLSLAREAADSCALDQVWFIPNAVPPHKSHGPVATWQQRFRMVDLACQSDSRFHASRLEEANRRSYTVYTLQTVRKQLSIDDELFFLIGADAFAEIESWYRKEEVFQMVTFIVLSRPGHEYTVPAGAKVKGLETLHMDVSSSDIRRRLASGDRDVPVPGPVLDYLLAEDIYTDAHLTDRAFTAAG
jgi:nicotinate-nucleotide adenylyltransferase